MNPRVTELERPRVAIVTGAASGIGAATVAELLHRGWHVAGFDLHVAAGSTLALTVDMADSNEVSQAVAEVERQLGPVFAAVSAAGHYEMIPVADIDGERWQRMLAVHLGGFVNLARALLPAMKERAHGSLISVTSELAIGGGSNDAHYAAAKGALIGLVRSLAAEVAPQGIRVNGVAPGPTDTPLLAIDSPWRAAEYLATLPLGRLTAPEEVALCIAFLAEEGTFCVGEILSPNAGAVI